MISIETLTFQYCVKIIDPMSPGINYVTYKSDCFYQTQIQVNPTNLSYVQGKTCYPYQDGSAPVKRFYFWLTHTIVHFQVVLLFL